MTTNEQGEGAATEPCPIFAGLATPWEEFYRCQTECLSRIANRVGVPAEQIEDVVQEVWLDAIVHREGFQGEGAEKRLACWLAIVAYNKSITALRCVKRRHHESLDAQPAEPMDCKTEEPTELMDAKEQGERLTELMEELREEEPLNCSLLVWQRIVEGRSVRDLAEETGLGCHAISCRIRRTLNKLQARILERCLDSDAAENRT